MPEEDIQTSKARAFFEKARKVAESNNFEYAIDMYLDGLRYTPEAGRVTLTVSGRAGGIQLSVADTGPGIDQDDLPHVFEKFYVARKYRRIRPEGSGLGLAIVKELVDTMGGTISAHSEPGQGTRFEVSIPAESPSGR